MHSKTFNFASIATEERFPLPESAVPEKIVARLGNIIGIMDRHLK